MGSGLDALRRIHSLGRWTWWKGSANHWEERYRQGGSSGDGSYGALSTYKASVLNRLVAENGISSVIEFGVGDGNQLSLAKYPRYLGLDVSATAIYRCRERFADDPTKQFRTLDGQHITDTADLTLSLDVIYHLVEDEVFESHMSALFNASTGWVAIYSSNVDTRTPDRHVRHRKFTSWVADHRPAWQLIEHEENPYSCPPDQPAPGKSFAAFYIYRLASPH